MTLRTRQGRPTASDSSNASRTICRKAGEEGSHKGRSPILAPARLSCSWVDDSPEGASTTTITIPPLVPDRLRLNRKSAATLRPFCFMTHRPRRPVRDAAVATSMGTWTCQQGSVPPLESVQAQARARVSTISEEGAQVPRAHRHTRLRAPMPCEEELAQIERLADDINQMRPFGVRNFKPEKAVVELPCQIVGSHVWAVNDRLGCLRCTETASELLKQEHRAEVELPLGIDYRDLLTCVVNPWRTAAPHEEPLPFPAVSAGRVDQIDVEAILRSWRSAGRRDQEEPVTAEGEAEAIAASIAAHEDAREPTKPMDSRR